MKRTFKLTALAASLLWAHQSFAATDCSSLAQWRSDSSYSGGTQVKQNNSAYQANWWSRGNSPAEFSGPWQEWSYVDDCLGEPFNREPQVNILSPLNNSQFTQADALTFAAQATDSDGVISEVEFKLGQQILATLTSAPYQIPWVAELGQYTLTVTATDDLGASSTEDVAFTVSQATTNQPPSISLTSPSVEDATPYQAGDNITLSANATDADGSVAQVDFYVNDSLVASDANAPFEQSYVLEAGQQTFKAKATDDEQASTFSASVSLTIETPNSGGCNGVAQYQSGSNYLAGQLIQNQNRKFECQIAGWCSSSAEWAYAPGQGQHWQDAWQDLGVCSAPPAITIAAPSENAVLLAGMTQTFAADASDDDGSITQVEFQAVHGMRVIDGIEYAGGTEVLGVDTTSPYAIDWVIAGVGEVKLQAVATDNEGNQTTATQLVNVSDQALVVNITSPAVGARFAVGKNILLEAQANALSGDVQQVNFLINGTVVATDTSAPYSANWQTGAAGSYNLTAQVVDTQGNSQISASQNIAVLAQVAKTHKLIGYWHNFVNGAGCPMRLADMSERWDVIDIAFAENDRSSNGTVQFNLFERDIRSTCPALDPAVFKQDMADLQAKGKVFVLSLGGAEGTITLNTDNDEANFVSSLTAIIKEWGFDGLDIDLESGSNLLHGSQIQARLPRALRQIEANIGGDMYLTMAPEHPYVHGGMVAYSGIWGAYIPVIDALRDTLDLLHVQLYNNGGLTNPYTPGAAPEGSVDMMVAASKMLVEGFELADGSRFAPLRGDQVAIGLPSGPSSANSGQSTPANISAALDCLTLGTQCGQIKPAFNYPNFGGVMTWSINWDQHDGFNFSGPVGDKLDAMNQR
ncbi:Ig-like domain-containing protein [Motilimonas pumila]|uniref:chitinase n=1 Tax=Motilimonas pumila TaxID=2303987 RepID=A0A418Y9L9_9GAMM|nr:Ig-like domain-containing protein [Motilimonas pumila]RJG37877.1 chitinase [Motilimonas pumila]